MQKDGTSLQATLQFRRCIRWSKLGSVGPQAVDNGFYQSSININQLKTLL